MLPLCVEAGCLGGICVCALWRVARGASQSACVRSHRCFVVERAWGAISAHECVRIDRVARVRDEETARRRQEIVQLERARRTAAKVFWRQSICMGFYYGNKDL